MDYSKYDKKNSNSSNSSSNNKKDKTAPYIPAAVPTIVPRFDVNDEAGIKYLEENGYVVFKDVASTAELETGKTLAWDFIESVTPGCKRNDPNSWDTHSWPDPFGKGIIVGDGAGHSPFLWHVRGIEKVSRIFKKIWNTEEVITSFDGFCMHRAWEYNVNWRTTSGNWYHVDQNGHHKPNRICVQGFLNFYPSGLTDGGLIIIPKSHLIFNQIFTNRPKLAEKNDFVSFYSDKSVWEQEIKAAKLTPIKVCAEPGDFVLWDSRIIHCNTPATEPRQFPDGNEMLPPRRLVAYVCMTPKSRVNYQKISARVNAFKQGITTSHWPEDCFTQNARKNKLANYVPPTLTPLQKSLIPME